MDDQKNLNSPQEENSEFAVNINEEDYLAPDIDTPENSAAPNVSSDKEEESAPVPVKKKKKKKKRSALRIIATISFIFFTAISIAAVLLVSFNEIYLRAGKSDQSVYVIIPEGATTAQIADILKEHTIVSNPLVFRTYVKLKNRGGAFMPGRHPLRLNMTYDEIIEEISKISVYMETVDVTIPEGFTINKVAALLQEKGVCSKADFINAVERFDYGFEFEGKVVSSSQKYYKMEGYLFPDTYNFYVNDDPKEVARRMFERFQDKIKDYYGLMEEKGMSLEETIILASIIQGESTDPRYIKEVSSVFHNRLNSPDIFPKLQSDATKKYFNEDIKPNMSVKIDEIIEEKRQAYDTYIADGLPVGAICSPGIDAIAAALSPSVTKYFFFCSNLETGECFFATTLKEHEINCKKAGLL